MIVAQIVDTVRSLYIPKTSPTLLAGQALTRTGALVTSTAGAQTMLGVLQADMFAFSAAPNISSVVYNQSRMAAVAVAGRLAIRVQSGQFAGLSAGAGFGLIAGEEVVIGVGSTVAATTLNGALLVVDDKIIGADGAGYIRVHVY